MASTKSASRQPKQKKKQRHTFVGCPLFVLPKGKGWLREEQPHKFAGGAIPRLPMADGGCQLTNAVPRPCPAADSAAPNFSLGTKALWHLGAAADDSLVNSISNVHPNVATMATAKAFP